MFNPNYSSSVSPDHQTGKNGQVKYKGVRLRKWGKWVSEIRLPNSRERIWLGSYDSAEKAARAFDAAQFCLRGPNAKFNFEDSPGNIDLPAGRILTPAEIQETASQYGNNFNDGDDDRAKENSEETGEINNNARVDDLVSQNTEVETTLPALSNASMDYDNLLEPNIIPNHDIVTSSGMTTSSVNAGVPDYSLMMSSLDHLHEDMYMTTHLGNRFYDGSPGEQQHADEHHYSQHSFLWNF